MSTPTEYRLLKERHEALRADIEELADLWAYLRTDAANGAGPSWLYASQRLRALLEGDTR